MKEKIHDGTTSIKEKIILNRLSSAPPPSPRGRWSFFRTSKTTFKRVLENLVPIDYDKENNEYNDGKGDDIDD